MLPLILFRHKIQSSELKCFNFKLTSDKESGDKVRYANPSGAYHDVSVYRRSHIM